MKIDLKTPGAEWLLITLDGGAIGCLEEVDTEAGYVLQRQITYGPKGEMIVGELLRFEGRVDILGNILVTDHKQMAEHQGHITEQLRRNSIWSNWVPQG
jgi:hypothetical protein